MPTNVLKADVSRSLCSICRLLVRVECTPSVEQTVNSHLASSPKLLLSDLGYRWQCSTSRSFYIFMTPTQFAVLDYNRKIRISLVRF